MTKNYSSSRAQKLALNSGTTRRSAKNAEKPQKFPSPPPYPALLEAVSRSLLYNRNVHDSGGELNLRHTTVEETTSLHDHRDVHNRR